MISFWSVLSISVVLQVVTFGTCTEVPNSTLNLVKGILEGKLQSVYDALVAKANASFVVTADYLSSNNIKHPWLAFRSVPLLHYAMGGGTEAHFRISSMLLAAGADPNVFHEDYPPAILYSFGYAKEESNEDMAATIQGVFQNEKLKQAFNIDDSLSKYHSLMGYASDPTILEYAVANRFAQGAFALIKEGQMEVNAKNANGATVLHYAAFHGLTSFTDLLLTHPSINPWETDGYGRTPLHYGVVRGHLPVLYSLLNSTALSGKDKKSLLAMTDLAGETALDLALHRPIKRDLVEYLVPLHRSLGVKVPAIPASVGIKEVTTTATTTATGGQLQPQDVKSIQTSSAAFTEQLGWRCSALATSLEKESTALLNEVPTVAASSSLDISTYLATQRPVLIEGNLTGTVHAWQHLGRDDFSSHFKSIQMFSVASTPNAAPAKVTLKDFLARLSKQVQPGKCESETDPSADCRGSAAHGSAGTPIAQSIPFTYSDKHSPLSKDFPLLPAFSLCTEAQDTEKHSYIQMSIGGYSSGEAAHGHGNSYEVQLLGRRKLVLVPPGALGPREYTWGLSSQVLLHWDQLMSFQESGSAYVVYQKPGDVLYIPAGWVHASVNLCDSVTVSTEFCSGVVDAEAAIRVPYNIHRQMYGAEPADVHSEL